MLIKSSYWKIREKIRDAFRRYYRRLQALYQGMARMARDESEQLFVLQRLVPLRFAGRKRQSRTTAPKRSILAVSYFSPPYREAYGTQRIKSAKVIITDDIKYLDDYLPISDVIRSRTTSITNGFDEEDFQGLPEPDPRREFTVSYIGSLYGQETFDLLLQPFRIWRQPVPMACLTSSLFMPVRNRITSIGPERFLSFYAMPAMSPIGKRSCCE